MRSVLALLFLLVATPLRAHEFWIAPEAWEVPEGAPIVAHLRVGEGFAGAPQSYFPQRFARFEVTMGQSTVPVEGRLGDIPAMRTVAPGAGLAIVVHETKGDSLVYAEAEVFARFIAHKDLAGVAERHAARGLPATGFREAYTRYAKALVAVGDGAGEDREVGLKTEIVALANPFRDVRDGVLPVRVLYQGRPRVGAQVELFTRAPDGTVTVSLHRTDAEGIARLPVTPGASHLADAVVMEDTGNDDIAAGAVWHSAWASLGFFVPAP